MKLTENLHSTTQFLPARLAALALLLGGAHAHAAAIYSLGHGDIDVVHSAGQFGQHYSLDAVALVDGQPAGPEPDDVIFSADALATLVPDPPLERPPGPEWDFLGTGPGAPVWFIPEVQEPDRPWLGFSSETLVFDDWTGLDASLTGISGPAGGHFSLFVTDQFATVFMATADGLTGADSFPLNVGSHAHFNWAFTQPGLYALELTITGEHVTEGRQASTATYTFAVGQVPEPGTWAAALALGSLVLARMAHRAGKEG